jgi:hypothetical protein
VDTHLPFMSPEESSYRTLSMYLTAQYFGMRMGQDPDWQLKDFIAHLRNVRETNGGFCARLRSLGIKDASLNALATLNAMGELTSLSGRDARTWPAGKPSTRTLRASSRPLEHEDQAPLVSGLLIAT